MATDRQPVSFFGKLMKKSRMTRSLIICLLILSPPGSAVPVARADLDPVQVRKAIDRAVGYLKSEQRNDGSWRDWVSPAGGASHAGAVTSLCTLALLNAGVDAKDPAIQRALTQIRRFPPQSTYATSLQIMALCAAKSPNDLPLIHKLVNWMVSNQVEQGPNKGAWSYPSQRSPTSADNSNTQFALLALHEAERVGVSPSVEDTTRVWRLAKRYWESCQNLDGSWSYRKDAPGAGTGSMTCAGIASMVIVSDKINSGDAQVDGDRILCCGQGDNEDSQRIERGLQWLGRNFSVTTNPGAQRWLLYYLYAVERVGRMTARRYIGGHDWYREGTDHLISKQDSLSGYFKGVGYAEDDPLVATSLALLFLSKGRRPLLIAKVKHPPADDWNQHRNDVGNLTRFVESQWKLDLTWQVVDLNAAKVEDLLQSPVLFFSGSFNPQSNSAAARREVAQKLRDYLDRGGFLFAEAYCAGSEFDKGFRDLMEQVFPEPEYRLRLLEPSHPIWRAEMRVAPEQIRPLWGIEFGCRTSVVYAPRDSNRPSLSCLWELSRAGRETRYSPSVRTQVDAALAIGINVLAYATNRELRDKIDNFDIRINRQQTDPFQRGRVVIAKLRHPGGCDAAPRALINLMEEAGNEAKLRTGVRNELLNLTDKALFDYHLAFMHGRHRFRLTDTERQNLRDYLEHGGMLFADAICGSGMFTDSFRQEMKTLLPKHKLEKIPGNDPLWSTTYGGFDLKTVTRREPQAGSGTGPLKATVRRGPPALEGIRIDDRWAVVFSPYDISCALEKHDLLQCAGYTRDDALRIGLNVILYSLQQ